ncbi:uncharacterized protein TNCV_870791 [Trichonephila clavipes]|nr:uncharacterized protein TNCV_870791 [Trichonephila clavipes]
MWTPQQKVQCALWLTEFKLVTLVQRRVLTEWNVVTGLPNRLIRTPTKGITHTINVSSVTKNFKILASLRYQSSRLLCSSVPLVDRF